MDWVTYGKRARRIRDKITDMMLIAFNRFRKKGSMYRILNRLGRYFSSLRMKLDDVMFNQDKTAETVFFGDRVLPILPNQSHKNKPLPFTEHQTKELLNLWIDATAFVSDIRKCRRIAPYLSKSKLERFEKQLGRLYLATSQSPNAMKR